MERSWVRGSSIGAGAFAAVHLAYDKAGRRVFAVKSVSLSSSPPAAVQSLENEISVLRCLRSPHVVAYLGDDTTPDGTARRRNLHLEFMPGGTAAAARSGSGSFPHLRDRARCVARALRYLHDVAGVVHCDVKGRNVLLGRDPGVAKLADFGLAVSVAAAGGAAPGGGGWARGTPLWMAPEVARGERPTPAADVWSLGCTVIEMATGAPPWPALSAGDAGGAMLRIGYGCEVPELPAQMSDAGRDFLDKCLRRDARERWTAEQLLRHPFLAKEDAAPAVDGPSPRGVLEWASWGFHPEDHSIEESCDLDSQDEILHCAKERMRGLDSGRGALNWSSHGWELVWSSESESMAEMEEEHHESGAGDSRGIRCSVSSGHFLQCSSSSSSSCCWKNDLGSKNLTVTSKFLVFDLCNFSSGSNKLNEITDSLNFEFETYFPQKCSQTLTPRNQQENAASGIPANHINNNTNKLKIFTCFGLFLGLSCPSMMPAV